MTAPGENLFRVSPGRRVYKVCPSRKFFSHPEERPGMACFMRHILDMSEYEDKIITVSAWPTRKTERVDLAKKNCSNDFVTVELSSRPLNFRHERRRFRHEWRKLNAFDEISTCDIVKWDLSGREWAKGRECNLDLRPSAGNPRLSAAL